MIHNNLFISNFKRIAAFLLALAVFAGVCKGLDYLYVQEDDFGRIVWHSFYEQRENIDNLFVGSSHVYCDINPFVLDELNGQNNFNLSIGNMRLNNMYYSIREANRRNKLSNVVIELYYETLIGDMGDFHSDSSVPNAWDSYDYMQPSLNKLEYMWTLSEKEQYIDTLFPFTRFRAHLLEPEYVAETVAAKKTQDYKNYKYRIEDERGVVEFQDKGYGYTTRVMEDNKFLINNYLSEEVHISEDAEKYLRKIMEYCKKENIPLTMVVTPMNELQLFSVGDYDSYRTQITGIAEEYGVPFYDFNLCREQYLDIQHQEYFMDTGHLNATGAAMFSKVLWEVLQNDAQTNADYFYSSFKEKMEQEPDAVFGVCYYKQDADIVMIVAGNKHWKSKYYVTAYPESGKKRVLLKKNSSNTFTVPADEHGVLKIKVKQKDTKSVQKIEVAY